MQPYGTHHTHKQRSLKNHFRRTTLIAALAGAAIGSVSLLASPAHAQAEAATFDIQLPAQPLGQALAALSRQTGVQVLAAGELVAGKTAATLAGRMTAQQALGRLLAGSGLQGRAVGQTLTVERAAPAAAEGNTLKAVTVTANAPETATGPVRGYLATRSATGMKTDTPVIETPQSISVVTAERIEAIGATNLKDALGYTPGVSITTYGADSRFDWISLRGFDAYSPGFYMDGLPLRNIATWGLWRAENYGAERIELLRGPASVLYGQAGPGGVVNVVSKRPTAEPLHEIQMQIGDHARRQFAGDFSGPLDEEGKVLYRVTGLVRDAQLPAAGMNDNSFYLAPSLTWRPNSDTSLTLLSHFSRTRSGTFTRGRPAVGSLVPTAAGTYAQPDLYTGEPGFNHFEQDQWAVGYELEHHVNDRWTVRQNARYGELDVDYRQVTGGGFAAVNGNPADPANYRTINRTVFASREKVKAFTLDNQLQGKFGQGDWRHTVLFGLDYQRSRFDQVTASGAAPTFDIYAPVYGQTVTIPAPYADAMSTVAQTGLYVQDQIKWGERWVATLGGRYDMATSNVDDRRTRMTTHISDNKFTGRAGLVYLHPSGWAPYASYSESFVPIAALDPATGRPLKPETGRQYEAGVRYQPPGRKDSYSAAVFDLRRQNYITYDASFAPKQTGEVVVRGVEFEATVQPVPRLNLTAAYSWTPKAIVTASSKPAEIDKQMTAVPKTRMSLWADYRFDGGFKMGLGARYTGANLGDGEMAPAKVPAFTLFDAMVGYDFARWSLALNVRNLANKTYLANCDAYGNCYYGDQRKVIATATYRW